MSDEPIKITLSDREVLRFDVALDIWNRAFQQAMTNGTMVEIEDETGRIFSINPHQVQLLETVESSPDEPRYSEGETGLEWRIEPLPTLPPVLDRFGEQWVRKSRLEAVEAERDRAKLAAVVGGELAVRNAALKLQLAKTLEALRWYAEQSWDTGEVHYGHGELARRVLAEIEEES